MKKEKTDRQLIIKVQPTLYNEFEKKCVGEYRTVSEVMRELMSKYVQGWVFMPGGLPVRPIWGRQGEWVLYQQNLGGKDISTKGGSQ